MSGPWIIHQSAIFPDYCQIIVKTPEDAAKATEQLIAGGVDVIKAQGGLNYDDLKAIVDTAHKHRGIKVHAHLYEETAVLDAFKAGVDILQHVGSAGVPPYSASTLKLLADSGRPVVPTAAHRPFIFPATVDFPERLQDPEIKATFPPDMWAEIQDSFKNFHTLGYFQATDRETIYADRDVEQFIKAGVVMGMGTDNGTPMNFHADALWREAKVFVDHGLPPIKAISSLTRINARIMGLQNQIGTIEVGKLADIIVVQGNPLFDITASLSNVEVVMKDGIIYKGGPSGGAGMQRTSAAR
jgi:imidazolonepropionase-like amidohydrolase